MSNKTIISKEKEKEILDFYATGDSLAATSRHTGISTYFIKKVLLKNNVKIRGLREQNIFENMKRAKKVDHNYFDVLNNENVYYLGFIAADGTVRKKNNNIKIGLSSVDKPFLEEMREKIGIELPIKDYITNNGFYVSELKFSSLKIKQELAKYSIVPNKTYIGISMKNIPDSFKLAFLKGFFDGDGSFYFNEKSKQCRVDFCSGTIDFLYEIKDFFSDYKTAKIEKKRQSGVCYNLRYGTIDSLKIMEQFYSINSPCLLRKKEKYYHCLDIRKQMNPKS